MEILPATSEDNPAIVALFNRYRFALRERHWLEWKYNANPAGTAKQYKIMDDGHIAGAVAIIPQRFNYRGNSFVGLQTVDGLLGMEVRGKGHFNRLMHFLTSQKPQGIDGECFYLSFPSLAASIKAHENAGWHRLSNFGLFTCLLTPELLFRKKAMPGLQRALDIPWSLYRKWIMGSANDSLRIRTEGDTTVDFNRMIETEKVSGDRSAAFMQWRVHRNPRDNIKTLLLYDRDKWEGYAICKIVARAAEITELRLRRPNPAYIQALIRHIHANQWGDTIDFWTFGPSPFIRLYRRLGCIPRAFSGALFVHQADRLGLPADPKDWDISYLDSDW